MRQKALYFLFLAVLILPNIILTFTEGHGLTACIAAIALPLAAYGVLMSLSRRTARTFVLAFPLLFLGAFQIVLTYLYGRGPIAVDMWLNLVTTNSGEVGELLSQLIPAIVWVVVIYIPSIAMGIVGWVRHWQADGAFIRRSLQVSLCGLAAALLFTAGATAAGALTPTNDIFPINACCNLSMAFGREKASAQYVEAVRDFSYNATCEPSDTMPQVIVCVIGETSRADNWQLYGYGRRTNPKLSAIGGLTVFTDYMSQSNTTHKSVPILLSPASAEDYDILYRTKGIAAAFSEAGYHTVFISNQQRNHSFIDFLGEQADEVLFLRDKQPLMSPDGSMVAPLARVLARSKDGRVFIILHTYGSHFDYEDRYPRSFARFKPDHIESAKRQLRTQLVNAYANSIAYTDQLLADIITMLGRHGGSTAMLYTADHGEDIFDDSRGLFLHASPFPSFYQLHVPLIVWTSEAYRQRHADVAAALSLNSRRPAASNSVFHTLLGMGGVSTPYRNDSLSLASRSYTPHRRLFIDDHNTPLTYRECMQEEDISLMKLKHISYE